MERLLRNEHGLREEGCCSLQTWRSRKFSSSSLSAKKHELRQIVFIRSGFTITIYFSFLVCFESFFPTRSPTSRSSFTVLSLPQNSSVAYLVSSETILLDFPAARTDVLFASLQVAKLFSMECSDATSFASKLTLTLVTSCLRAFE